MQSRFTINVVHEYQRDGVTKKQYVKVGTAWLKELDGGRRVIELRMVPGVALAGDAVCFEPKDEKKAEGQ